MAHVLALLRGINVGGRNRIAMADVKRACADAGLGKVRTYIASGNIMFDSVDDPAALETMLEDVIARHFALTIPVVVRTAQRWGIYAAGSPFPEAERDEPNRLMLCLSKRSLPAGAAEALKTRAVAGERIVEDRGALWVHCPGGAGTSRLSPALFDRAAGSPITARNWRTVLTLDEMLGGAG